jgi:hypothetical protein
MGAPVVVQGLPVASDLRAAALSACSEALKHRACVGVEERSSDSAPPFAVARITTTEGTERRVRVVLEGAAEPAFAASRETRFAPEDPPVEQWRATGLVIAALAGESASRTDERSYGTTSLDHGTFAAPSAGWLALAANGGPGLDDGSARFGGSLQGAVALRGSPVFFSASVGHAWRPADDARVGVTWTTVSAGGGLRTWLAGGDVELRARVELLGEYIAASSTATTLRGGGNRLMPGLRAGADALWPARGPLGVTLGLSVWSLSGGTAITLDEQKVGSSPWLSYAGWMGAQWSFR